GADAQTTQPPAWWLPTVITLSTVSAAALLHPSRAAWSANLGALAQAHAELRSYDPNRFDKPTIDEVRRTGDLGYAAMRFREAEQRYAANPTAGRRLAMMLLAERSYEEGLRHIDALWSAGDRSDATRAVLGQALIAGGRVDDALVLLRDDAEAVTRLKYDGWY